MHDSYKDAFHDAQLDIRALRDQVEQLKTDLKYAMEALGNKELTTVPLMDDDLAECGECCCRLERDWMFCPGCGYAIDWHSVEYPDDRDEDEGDKFLRNEVYEPLREAMRNDAL